MSTLLVPLRLEAVDQGSRARRFAFCVVSTHDVDWVMSHVIIYINKLLPSQVNLEKINSSATISSDKEPSSSGSLGFLLLFD
jgi:DNA-directed RNA polymerase